MSVVVMHPPITGARAIPDDSVDGGYLINYAGIIAIAKEGETAKSRLLYLNYCQEYRMLEGQGLEHKDREAVALRAALARMGINIIDASPNGSA